MFENKKIGRVMIECGQIHQGNVIFCGVDKIYMKVLPLAHFSLIWPIIY